QLGPVDAMVQRVSYTGDLGYEIYVSANQQIALYTLLREAGEPFAMRPFGMHAMMSLRLEKSFGSWMREFKPACWPLVSAPTLGSRSARTMSVNRETCYLLILILLAHMAIAPICRVHGQLA
ncbi:MAG: hypothetical protein DRR42_24480, partial [Gammaproteobacteria bacterium]